VYVRIQVCVPLPKPLPFAVEPLYQLQEKLTEQQEPHRLKKKKKINSSLMETVRWREEILHYAVPEEQADA